MSVRKLIHGDREVSESGEERQCELGKVKVRSVEDDMDSTNGVDSMTIADQSGESQVLVMMIDAKSRGPQRLQEVEDPLVDQISTMRGHSKPKFSYDISIS